MHGVRAKIVIEKKKKMALISDLASDKTINLSINLTSATSNIN